MIRWLTSLALLLLLPGCIFLDGSGGGDVSGGYAPRIDSAFPSDAGSQFLAVDSSLPFSASGEDLDSLDLEWDWMLDDELLSLGSSDDGRFDDTLEIAWSPDRAGNFSELRFAVSDGSYETELFWSLSFE